MPCLALLAWDHMNVSVLSGHLREILACRNKGVGDYLFVHLCNCIVKIHTCFLSVTVGAWRDLMIECARWPT